MKRMNLLVMAMIGLAFVSKNASAELPAFPGAEGFGALATGGRGGEVYHVTTLKDSGKGSFRDAVSKPHRTIVFDVGGYIELESMVSASSDLTIAGQSAPGQGIGILNYEVSFSNCDNLIVRYVRFRQGVNNKKQDKKYAIAIQGKNVIFDHCSIQWGRWDCIGLPDSDGVTLQWCIIGEGVAPQRFGALVESDNVTFSHNLWTNNQSRNPKAKGTIQYINNVVYNWGVTGLAGGHSAAPHYLDAINNYFIKGSTSNDKFTGEYTDTDKVYQSGNVADLNADGKLDGQPVDGKQFTDSNGGPTLTDKPYLQPKIPVTTQPAADALKLVLDHAGCSLKRDSVDARLIDEVRTWGTQGKRIKDPAESGGPGMLTGGDAPVDTDRDGIPDAWETAHHLNPQDATDGAILQKSGYTALEEYLNELATPRR